MLRIICLLFMSVKFFLKDNHLTPDPNDYRAETVKGKTNDMEDIIDMMMHRPVGVSRVEVTGVMEELFIAMEFLLLRGESIETSLFKLSPKVKGVFESEEAPFDPSKHKVKLRLLPGNKLGKIAKQIPVEKIAPIVNVPSPSSLMDMASQQKNQTLTVGKPARLQGNKLKFDAADPQQGVFLINDSTDEEFRADFILDNTPKTVTFVVPEGLAAGSYQLELRSNLGTKELKVGSLSASLIIT